jgi:hypothetical protein
LVSSSHIEREVEWKVSKIGFIGQIIFWHHVITSHMVLITMNRAASSFTNSTRRECFPVP